MDKLKGFAEKAMHSAGDKSSSATTGNQGSSGGGEDYGDKGNQNHLPLIVRSSSADSVFSVGIDFAEKKLGVHLSREQNEEYSDKARELYEKEVSQF
jgi:hypothetical protein